MKVLVVGSGGREHALIWKIKQFPKVEKIYAAPGNGGTAEIAENVLIKDTEIEKIVEFAKEKSIDLVVVGPEIPLNLGLADELEKVGIRAFGPKKNGARIEGSKAWSKYLFQKYNIPCAKSQTFEDGSKARDFLNNASFPIVLKADGLAAGKGVLICKTKEEAEKGIDQIMVNAVFGDAGKKLIIEEFLEGKEVSVLAFTDGKSLKLMVPACDYKRAYDNDEGLNTGGMGVYSPPKFYKQELENEIIENILKPTLDALRKEGVEYKGVLYAGLILTKEGPKILEYNCRFGDPETQVILPRLKTDMVEIFEAVLSNQLEKTVIEWDMRACVGVVLASGGYPQDYDTGFEIKGLKDVGEVIVFHAGTKLDDGKFLTNGGRVLCISALREDIVSAREKVYEEVGKISFENMHFRKDIGLREVEKVKIN
ncbi:MAG: phosphoribosylamine--glycine ligase [Patescibacteria group bacterium]|nr:phosphoribosylamine--glycine ligase [Patescibacteria group bacterium]